MNCDSHYLWWHNSWFLGIPCRCSVANSCPALCNLMDYSTPGFSVLYYCPEFAQTYVHWVNDAIQPSHPVTPFSSCPQSFPASGSFPMSLLLASDGQKCCSFSLSISPFNEQELTVIGFRTIRKLTMRTGKFRPPPAVRGLHLHPRQVSSSHTPGGKQRAAWPGEHWECSPSGPRERDWTAHLDPHDTEAWEVCSEPQ